MAAKKAADKDSAPSFSARTSGSDDLKAIISAISTVVEEATFVANAEGITFRGMDPSHVALIDISWPNSAFEKYECDEERKFGVRIDEFSKLIKRATKKDPIELSISEENMMVVAIGTNKKYKIRLIEGSATDTPLPKITYDTRLEIATAHFDKVLGDVQVVSDYLKMESEGSKTVFGGEGDSGEVSIELDESMDGIEKISCEKPSSGSYSLEYLSPVVKAVGGATEVVTCEYSAEKPVRVEFKVSNVGRIHFYLAPRVEN